MAKAKNKLRAIPGVDTILEVVKECSLPRPLVVRTIREELKIVRKNKVIPKINEKIIVIIRDISVADSLEDSGLLVSLEAISAE